MRLATLLVLAACGDSVATDALVEPVSGTRIKLEKYLYEDGTQQLAPGAYYDEKLHTRCSSQTWIDGVQRCVPLDVEAVYIDSACTEVQGIVRATPDRDPTLYVVYDTVGTDRVPSRMFRAGVQAEHSDRYYERHDGACTGPYSSPSEAIFVTVTDELSSDNLAIMIDSEVGTGRLALHVQTTPDGLFAPVEVRDRTLDVACTPALQNDGVACEPATDVSAFYFANASCTEPAIVVANSQPLPSLVRGLDPTSGCPTFHTTDAELFGNVWFANNGECTVVPLPANERAFALGPATELARLDRTVEDVPGTRRFAHVTLADASDPAFRFAGPTLVDRAIRGECQVTQVGHDFRCLPATVWAASVYADTTCERTMEVAPIPVHSCTPLAFAMTQTDDGLGVNLHAVGDPAITYNATASGCQPYTSTDRVLHAVGPDLPPETFPAAQRYGER